MEVGEDVGPVDKRPFILMSLAFRALRANLCVFHCYARLALQTRVVGLHRQLFSQDSQ
jgi:hypothetical protein